MVKMYWLLQSILLQVEPPIMADLRTSILSNVQRLEVEMYGQYFGRGETVSPL